MKAIFKNTVYVAEENGTPVVRQGHSPLMRTGSYMQEPRSLVSMISSL